MENRRHVFFQQCIYGGFFTLVLAYFVTLVWLGTDYLLTEEGSFMYPIAVIPPFFPAFCSVPFLIVIGKRAFRKQTGEQAATANERRDEGPHSRMLKTSTGGSRHCRHRCGARLGRPLA